MNLRRKAQGGFDEIKYPHDSGKFHELDYFKTNPDISSNPELDTGSEFTLEKIADDIDSEIVKYFMNIYDVTEDKAKEIFDGMVEENKEEWRDFVKRLLERKSQNDTILKDDLFVFPEEQKVPRDKMVIENPQDVLEKSFANLGGNMQLRKSDVIKLETPIQEYAIDLMDSLIIDPAYKGDKKAQKEAEYYFEEGWESIKKKLETEGSGWHVWFMDGVNKFISENPDLFEKFKRTKKSSLRIKSQKSRLINDENVTGDKSKIYGDASNIYGDASNIVGDVSNIRGNVSYLKGDVSNIKGDVSYIEGNVTNIEGDVTGLRGNIKDLLEKYPNRLRKIASLRSSLNRKSDTTINIDTLNVSDNSTVKFRELPELSEGVNMNMERKIDKSKSEKKLQKSYDKEIKKDKKMKKKESIQDYDKIYQKQGYVKFSELKLGDKFQFENSPDIYTYRRFDPRLGIVTASLDDNTEFKFKMNEYKDENVMKYRLLLTSAIEEDEFEVYDRVQLQTNGLMGYVIYKNDEKPGDIDYIIKWDTPVAGETITEVHPTEIIKVDEEVTEEKKKELDKEIEKFLKAKDKYKKEFDDKTQKKIKKEIKDTIEKESSIKEFIKANIQLDDIVNAVIEDANLLKKIATEDNKKIDINYDSIIEGYMDEIFSRISKKVKVDDFNLFVNAAKELIKEEI